MIPGSTLIVKAPGCQNPVKFSTIASGNTFGAVYWTDGKRDARMLPDEPWLRKSPSEGVMFWSDECEEIGQIDFCSRGSEKPEWEDLDYAVEPSEDDYVVALQSGLVSTPEKERYIRMRLWWRGNDPIRRGEITELSVAHQDNLKCFEAILSEGDDNQRLMKAEVLRHLSRFDDALRLLDSEFPETYSHAVQQIRDLVLRSDYKVATLT